MRALEFLENSALGMWVAASDSLWGYPTILTMHTFGMGLLVGASAVLDLRLLGFARHVPVTVLRKVSRPVWIGFAVNAVTGALLFVAAATEKGTQKIFAVKLTLILIALLADRRARRVIFSHSTAFDAHIPIGARLLAATSLLFWAGAITAGRLMAYIHW